MPIAAIAWLALFPQDNIWPHLISTTLPRYLGNTLVLMVSVGMATAVIGAGSAWLVVMYRFPGRRWLQWALLAPLAVPAYVGAYALVDFLEYAGPVQRGLRAVTGWETAADYWFPQIRSRGAAAFVLTMSLYPYVYLLARGAFREQSGAGQDVARALGTGAWGRFWRVGLPMARPAIAAGVAIAMMEAVNDYGTVDFFAVQTLTTGIFAAWSGSNNLGGAAQIAAVVLVLIVCLVLVEKKSRQHIRVAGAARGLRPIVGQKLLGPAAWGAMVACALPVFFGFFLPVLVLGAHALTVEDWLSPGLARSIRQTLTVCGAAALACVLGALFMVYGARLSDWRLPRALVPVTAIGYAAPGAVLAIGLLIPLGTVDHAPG